MHSNSGRGAVLVFAWLVAARVAAAADYDASAGLLYQDNVSRADRSADREADGWARADAGVQQVQPVGLAGAAWARVEAGAEAAFTFDDLSSVRLGGALGASYKMGLGPRAPRLELAVPVDHAWYGDPDRQRWVVRPAVHLRKRVSESLELDGFLLHESTDAASALFDAEALEGGAVLRWQGEGPWSAQAGYRLRDGDVVAYATPPRPDLVADADLVVTGLETFGHPMNGYRLEARTQRVLVGAGFALDERSMIEMGYEWQDTRAGDLQYDDHLVHLGWRRAF